MEAKWRYPIIFDGVPTEWGWIVKHPENLKLGEYTDIGAFTLILAHNGVIIGDRVQIGSHCAILSKSTIDHKDGKIIIRRGACVGTHSTIMPGVIIGEGAIVAAHSFVNQNVPDFAIVGGVPARMIIDTEHNKQDLMWSTP